MVVISVIDFFFSNFSFCCLFLEQVSVFLDGDPIIFLSNHFRLYNNLLMEDFWRHLFFRLDT